MTDDQAHADDTAREPTPTEEPTQTTEPAAAAAPATPSAAEPALASAAGPAAGRPAGPSRARWIVALGLVGIVVALAIGGALLLGSASAPEALRYVPADAGFVAEVRMDLPGDQLQKVGNLLAHFPGFADQSTLGTKLDEAFGRFVSQASNNQADYLADIKPWLNGPLFISGSADSTTSPDPAGRHFVAAATVNGGVDCARAFKGKTLSHESYKGLDIASDAAAGMACVIDGRFALLGDPASVKAAIDARAAGNGMDKSADYQAARKQLTGDQLATVYVNGARLKSMAPSPDPSLGIPGLSGLGALGGEIPAWAIVGARAEDDAIVIDTVTAPVATSSSGASLLPAPPVHASVTAPLVPAGTLVYFEDQGTGVSIQNLLSRLRSVPELEQPLQVLDGAGGAAGLAGWIDDVAVAVAAKDPTLADPHVKATALLVATDDATAGAKLATIKGFLGLAGIGGGITVTTETLSGVEVTNVTITDLGSLVPPGSVPSLGTGALDTPVTFSIAAKGRVIYIGYGDGAMAEVLAVQPGSSLADDAAFKLAGQRGLANSKATVYVAVGATVDMVKGLLPSDVAAKWATDYAPYVEPLQALGVSVSMEAATNRSRMVLTVSNP
ncbi:MAG TPA: DUF3352 domain-containing protein [Candidatus Limnocylindrales bacterium]|nr:DUF3352 domain-containing protein [Candidatus Limnocylindrales bacterium]